MPPDTENVSSELWRFLAYAGGIPAALGGWKAIGIAIRWMRSEHTSDTARGLTAAQKIQEDLLAQRAVLTKEQADFLESIRAELVRCYALIASIRAELAALGRDRDRGWDLARWWNRRCQDMRNVAANNHMLATDMALVAKQLPPPTPDLTLPAFEAAVPPT